MTSEFLPDEQERALATELGIPPGTPWARLGLEGTVYGPKLQGYALEFFGIPLPLSPTPPDGPFVYVERLTAEGRAAACNVQAWLTTVTYRKSPVYGEVRWHPKRGQAISIRGLELDYGTAAAEGARRGLALLLCSSALRGGRPRGNRKGRVWDRQDYLDWYREAGQAYARDGDRLTLRHLGEAMGVSDDTARERLRAPGVELPWPPDAYLEIWDPDPDE